MASQGRSGSGVRNLLAMFENKDDSTTSPPPNRGRSPAPSIGSNSASPRPLSKVRTSFVAVERNGQSGIQWGLRKESSTQPEESTMANRRASFSENEATDPKVTEERKKSIADEFQARKNSVDVTEIIPEFAVGVPQNTGSKQQTPKIEPKGAKPAVKKPTGNPDKRTSVEEPNTKLLPADTTSVTAVSGGKALKGSSGIGENLNKHTKTADSAKLKDKVVPGKPAAISTSKTSNVSTKANKSPALPKTPVTPNNPAKSNSKATTAAASKATKPTIIPTTTAATKKANGHSTATSSNTNPAAKKPATVPPSTGFVKPRPKSPTRPAKLPSSLTAPTSSSLSKLADGADPRRASGATASGVKAAAGKSVPRPPSQVSAAQKAETQRKTTSRPSLGPPPSAALHKQPSRQSLPKSTAPPDESFLARMMRPTTSSASKTHDKAETPPKAKLQSRPSTRNGSHAKLESHGSPVAPKQLPAMPNVTKLNQLHDKNAAKGGKKAELPAKKVHPTQPVNAKASKSATAEPIMKGKSVEPVSEIVNVPETAPTQEQPSEPAPVEEGIVEEAKAPVTIVDDSIPAQTEVDDSAPVVNVEELAPVTSAPTEEAAEPAAAAEAAEAETEEKIEDTVTASEPVTSEDQPVVSDKVDVASIIEETEKVHEAEKAEEEGAVETETESAELEVETSEAAVDDKITTDATVEAPEQTVPDDIATTSEEVVAAAEEAVFDTIATTPEDVVEAAKETASDDITIIPEEVLEAHTISQTATEETTESESEKAEDDYDDKEAEHPTDAEVASDTSTPMPAATPVLAL